MKHKLVHSDSLAIENKTAAINKLAPALNTFLQGFNSQHQETLISNGVQLFDALADPLKYLKNFIREKMPKEEHGLPVDIEAKLSLLKFPDLSAVTNRADEIKAWMRQMNVNYPSEVFEVKGNEVKVNKDAFEKEINVHRKFIDGNNKYQVEFIEKQEAFRKAFYELQRFCVKTFEPHNALPSFKFDNLHLSKLLIESDETINPAFSEYFFSHWPVK